MTFRNPPFLAYRLSHQTTRRVRAGGERGGEAKEGGFLKVIPTVKEDYEQRGRLRAAEGCGLIHHAPPGFRALLIITIHQHTMNRGNPRGKQLLLYDPSQNFLEPKMFISLTMTQRKDDP
jgi:hypothetical protein